jgi:cytochrome c oxidase subunit 2
VTGKPLRTVVGVAQFIAVSSALAFVVLLFVNEPDRPAGQTGANGASGGESAEDGGLDGSAIYAENCAACHGPDGGGGVGPQLSEGQIVTRFPDIEDQIAVVTTGLGPMPAFGERLSPEEIRAVVEYTREL